MAEHKITAKVGCRNNIKEELHNGRVPPFFFSLCLSLTQKVLTVTCKKRKYRT